MSISPQSLARTRDKRSLRIPARFDDFIPPEATYKNVAEALKMKGKTNKRQSSSSESVTHHEPNPKKPALESAAGTQKRPPPRQRSSTSATAATTTTTTTAAAATAATVAASTIQWGLPAPSSPAPKNKTNLGTRRIELPSSSDSSSEDEDDKEDKEAKKDKKAKEAEESKEQEKHRVEDDDLESVSALILSSDSSSEDESEEGAPNPDDIDLECKETAATNIDFKTNSPEPSDKPTREEEFFVKKVLDEKDGENIALVDASESIDQVAIKKIDDNILKKSPFHPSITISNGIRLNGPINKPLTEKRLSTAPSPSTNTTTTTTTAISSSTTITSTPQSKGLSASQRKKSKGFSLMVKPSGGPQIQGNNNNNASNNNLHRHPQQTKYFNNLTQSMQYGTRLMLNEPIYLPRSVASIAPITTTLQQIANQARKPPFISKKAEAYIAYQEGRKLNFMTSIHTALVKIVKYLNIRDVLKMRLVNKTWKSIIDTEEVWRNVKVTPTDISFNVDNWWGFTELLTRHHTSELMLEGYDFEDFDWFSSTCERVEHGVQVFISWLASSDSLRLKQLTIKTVNEHQNRKAMEFLAALNFEAGRIKYIVTCAITWKVKVSIDEFGVAFVPIECRHDPTLSIEDDAQWFYCYSMLTDLVSSAEKSDPVLVELSDLENLFDEEKVNKELACGKNWPKFRTVPRVEPI